MKNKTECRICDNNKSTRQLCDKHYDEFIAFSEGKNQPLSTSPKLEEMLRNECRILTKEEYESTNDFIGGTLEYSYEQYFKKAEKIQQQLIRFFNAGQQSTASHMISDEEINSEEEKCETGCIVYTGGERKHHKDCIFYPDSLTKKYEELEIEYNALLNAPQQQEIDWEILKKEMDDWFISFPMNDYPSQNQVFDWLKQRPEFSQPTGERDKELAIKFANWLSLSGYEPWDKNAYKWYHYKSHPGATIYYEIPELFDLFLTQKQK